MEIVLLYLLALGAAAYLVLISLFRRDKRHLRKSATVLFLLHVAIYLVVYLLVFLDPYWYDNGSQEFIPVGDRWKWALLYCSFLELLAGPVLFIGFLFLKKDPPEEEA